MSIYRITALFLGGTEAAPEVYSILAAAGRRRRDLRGLPVPLFATSDPWSLGKVFPLPAVFLRRVETVGVGRGRA